MLPNNFRTFCEYFPKFSTPRDRELSCGGGGPRTMCLDDYFDCDGEYEYEEDMEEAYRSDFFCDIVCD